MEDLFLNNIEKYVYDECTKEELNLFKKHIESCEKCREEYNLSCAVKNAMSSMNTIAPPADFSKLVNERLDRELAAPAKPRLLKAGYRKYSAVAACLVLAAVLGTQNTEVSEPVIETSTFTNQSLQSVPDNAEPQATQAQNIAPVASAPAIKKKVSTPEVSLPVIVDTTIETSTPSIVPMPSASATTPESTASTVNASVVIPAVTVPTPETTQTQQVKNDDVLSKIPSHLNPQNQVVLASSVEKTYEISGVSPEEVPRKERNLAAEFALLDTTNSGDIVANAATIARMPGVAFQIVTDSEPKDYGVGSGSLFISSSDKEIVDEILPKYITVTDDNLYFFTHDNYNLFMQEMNDCGIEYQERAVVHDGGNVAFKIISS